ncbi:MAG: thiolase family protein [Dehalococcoidia bacterium]|nr:thiolase family protein [Dehalococcoidia bacterium]
MTIRGRAAIAGYAELPTLRNYGERSAVGLMAEATRIAIADAGLTREDIDGLVTGERTNSLSVAQALDLRPRYTATMTVHGASGAASIITAAMAISSGMANHVLCVFSEAQPLSAEGGGRFGAGGGTLQSEWEAPFGPVVAANGSWGLIQQRHMFEFGTTQEQIAKCVVDERFNAVLNENAIWRGRPITIEDVLNSRYTNDPMHLLQSTMPCHTAFATVVTSAERARALRHPPAYILGVGGPSAYHDAIWHEERITHTPVAVSAPAALRMAGYGIRDVQFAEFYDGYAMLVMVCLEDAGVCPKGEIGRFYESTDTTYRGAFPVNTDGGQLGAGWTGGGGTAGFRHVVEGARQVMRRAGPRQVERADLCLVNGCGGIASAMATVVLGSEAAL